MRKLLAALLLCAFALAQDEGREVADERPILFVRWERTAQRGKIYLAAWQALEPHHGMPPRLRLKDLDGDEKKAKAFFAEHKDARLVIAVDDASAVAARAALPGVPVLSAGVSESATVSARVGRGRLVKLMRLLHPDVASVGVYKVNYSKRNLMNPNNALSPARVQELPELELFDCAAPNAFWQCDLAWWPEGGESPGSSALRAPLVVTADSLQASAATMTVLPDPESLGRKLAAVALGMLRDGKPPPKEPLTVSRLRVMIDLQAARAISYEVPLAALARADEVRRAR